MEGKNPREGCAALVLGHYHQRRAGVARIRQTWLPSTGYDLAKRSHRLTGQRRIMAAALDTPQTLTCCFGLRRASRAGCI
jgi:hypothetical protein